VLQTGKWLPKFQRNTPSHSRDRGYLDPMHLIKYVSYSPRSRKCGSIHPLLPAPSWCSAILVKYMDNFTLPLYSTYQKMFQMKVVDINKAYILWHIPVFVIQSDMSFK
jgi:hypothetical protein